MHENDTSPAPAGPRSVGRKPQLASVGATAALVRGGQGPVRDWASGHTRRLPTRGASAGAGQTRAVSLGRTAALIRGPLPGGLRDLFGGRRRSPVTHPAAP
jgi:hypothetical protein